MDQDKLEKQARFFITIMENLNGITKIMVQYGIDDSTDLIKDKDALDSLCHKAIKIYETYRYTCIDNNQKYNDHRARLVHISDKLKKDNLNGFDKLEPQELWNDHFSGAIDEIRVTIQRKLEGFPTLSEEIENITSTGIQPPIKLLEATDYSHLNTIKEITNSISDHIICLVGILSLMSEGSTPPQKDYLYELVSKITNSNTEQLEFVTNELENKAILSKSVNDNYILLKDKKFGINVTRDFLESYDINEIVKIIGQMQ